METSASKSVGRISTAAPRKAGGGGGGLSELAILFLQIDKCCSLPDSGPNV